MKNLHIVFIKFLRESFRDLLPIIFVILFFQLIILQTIPSDWKEISIGVAIVGVGLAIFLMGLQYGIFPIGERLTKSFTKKKGYFWIMFFGFLIGFSTTIAEPALYVIAEKAAIISGGKINPDTLRLVVALSVGTAIATGIMRILKGISIQYTIILGYAMVLGITYFTPKEIVGLAYDLGGVTTSTITVPLIAAIGIGIAATAKKKNPIVNGFGLIACASLMPMFFVQVYGIIIYNYGDSVSAINEISIQVLNTPSFFNIKTIVMGLLNTIKDVLPIILTIIFFQYIILREKIPFKELKSIALGFAMVILGLYFFILGLEMGLFNLGSDMANQLTKLDNNGIIYLFAFSLGFATTMAEPTLIAIASKASEITHGRINPFVLRIFVALGVGIGITIGSYRIIYGDFILYYIMIGYIFVIFLTFFAPKHIIAIAYDSGGVTTSTITVPLVAALGIGLATNIPGRDPLTDGFGLIAFASLFPILSVLGYGIITKYYKITPRKAFKCESKHNIPEVD